MKHVLRWAIVVVMMAGLARLRAEDFSKSLTPDEFAAAGLSKLSPEELAKLDALIKAEQSGQLAKAREEAAAQEKATAERVRAETAAKVQKETEEKVRAEVAAQKPAEPKKGERMSVLGRMRVLLSPGAEIEYAKVETQLSGPFRGYEPGTVLALSNGQTWRVVSGTYWAPASDANKVRHVVIEPGVLGSFFLNIEDGGRPKVKLVSNPL
jgi:hypothetical protein